MTITEQIRTDLANSTLISKSSILELLEFAEKNQRIIESAWLNKPLFEPKEKLT